MFDCSSIFPFKYQNHFTNNLMKELDINVDIGEGFNIEAEIMPLINHVILLVEVMLAIIRNVKIDFISKAK